MLNQIDRRGRAVGSWLPGLALAVVISVAPHACDAADGQLLLTAVDKESGQAIACRIHLLNSNGRSVKMPGTAAWADHFDFKDKVLLKLPVGRLLVRH